MLSCDIKKVFSKTYLIILMNTAKFVHNYIDKIKFFQEKLLEYLENDNDEEMYFNNLSNYFNEQQFIDNKHNLKVILRLIAQISTNFHQSNNFFNKIERIINSCKEKIQNYYTNIDIFSIFKDNKKILYFLFKEKILIPDIQLSKIIQTKKYKKKFYCQFFYPEFKSFYNEDLLNDTLNEHPEINEEDFEENRKFGENNSQICKLIKNDSIDEFVTFSTQMNLNYSSKIQNSIFETNSFLLKNEDITLIEYAAFYGSIQIFNFLRLNNAEMRPILWLHAIHGRNADIFHLLEENRIEKPKDSFERCLQEAIKCHHNDFANYIQENLMNNSENIVDYCFRYYNFQYLQEEEQFDEGQLFYIACHYDYYTLVDFLLTNGNVDLSEILSVSYLKYFFYFDDILNHFFIV